MYHIPQEIRQQACEGLLHFYPKKTLARELGVSVGAIQAWAIFTNNGFFDWVSNRVVSQRKELLHQAVDYWFAQYPIGYTDVAKQFGIRPSTLYATIQRAVARLRNSCAQNAFVSGTLRQQQLQENSRWPSRNFRISQPIAR